MFTKLLTTHTLVIALAAVLAAGATLGGLALAGALAPTTSGATITVTGSGLATGTPDVLTVQMGVSTTASSATGALQRNNTEMTGLQAVLIRAGVRRADLQTSGLSVSANYSSSGSITGYSVSDELAATLRDLARAGAVIDAASGAVGNDIQISGITFSISHTSSLLRAARTSAVANAHTEALEIAEGAGVHLAGIRQITDQEQQSSPQPLAGSFAAASAKAAVPIQAGTEEVTVQVQVVYWLSS